MSNTKVTVEVLNDNPFNAGWLLYLLGQPQPEMPEEPEAGADPSRAAMDATARVDGWKMASDTPTVTLIRRVFGSVSEPNYSVTVRAGVEPVKEPVTE